jgi:hypothetical protein
MSIVQIGAACTMVAGLVGCSIGKPMGYVNAEAWSANYTEDYIPRFTVETLDGRETKLEGVQIKPFSKGGTGGVECCTFVPSVGQTVRIVWLVGRYDEPAELWTTHTRSVRLTGALSKTANTQSALIVRFFPGNEVEAEFVPMDKSAGNNPRDDQLYYGRQVMRHIGE